MHYVGNTDAEGKFDILLSFLLKFARGEIRFSETVEREVINYITDGKRNISDEHKPRKVYEQPITKYTGNRVEIFRKKRTRAGNLRQAGAAAIASVFS
jgi:hypothetical protein